MIIKDISPIKVSTRLVEPEVNRSATEWLMKNYDNMVKRVKGKGIIDKAEDLINDVYLSLYQAESNGEGFNINYGNGKPMAVETFVIGRIDRYAMAKEYKSSVVEKVSYTMNTQDVVMEEKLEIDGTPIRDSRGNIAYNKKTVCRKTKIEYVAYAAVPVDSSDEMSADTSISYKYTNAVSESATRELENIDDAMSVESSIAICVDIADKYSVDIMNIFKNIDCIAEALKGVRAKKEEAVDVFYMIRRIAEENDEFKNAFVDVMSFSERNKDKFRCIVSNI